MSVLVSVQVPQTAGGHPDVASNTPDTDAPGSETGQGKTEEGYFITVKAKRLRIATGMLEGWREMVQMAQAGHPWWILLET